jgi:hypothetical protein
MSEFYKLESLAFTDMSAPSADDELLSIVCCRTHNLHASLNLTHLSSSSIFEMQKQHSV